MFQAKSDSLYTWRCLGQQPLSLHWKFMDKLAQSLNAKIIAPIYPKVPHFSYQHTYPKLVNRYLDILSGVESPGQVTLMGDSAGGNIALGLAQLLKVARIPQPKDIILLSACLDMRLDNPELPIYEKKIPCYLPAEWKSSQRKGQPIRVWMTRSSAPSMEI
jgi:acetyl esterase/lipase